MSSLSSIALSGMNAAQTLLNASANNVANLSTEGFHREVVVQRTREGGGVDTSIAKDPQAGSALEADLVSQLQAKNAFLANLAVFKTSHRMAGALLDQKA